MASGMVIRWNGDAATLWNKPPKKGRFFDGDEAEVSHTQGPIDGSLYATVGKKPLPLSADSVYTTSMDSGISSAGNGLQPASAEVTNVGCLSSENQRALDELLNDMLLTVEGIPDLKPNAALYQSRAQTKSDLQRQQRPGGDARYLACCPVSASSRQSTNERVREHDRSFPGTPKTSVTTPNQDNALDEIPYHARQDSRPFTYSAIPHDAMTHGQASVLSSPGLVRKASFKTPNGVAVPVGGGLSNGGARVYNDYSRTTLDGSRSPELLDGGDRRAQHLTWLQRQQKKLRERREYALRSQRQPHEARLLSELRALHGASHRPDGYTSDTTMFADEDEEDFSVPLHINTTGAKLNGGSSAPGSPLLNRSTRRQQPPYALNRQKSDCSFDREKPFAAVKRFHEENARRYAETSPPETPRTTVPSPLNHNQDHRVLTTNNQYNNYLYLQNNGVDEVDFPSTLIEDDRRRTSVRQKGVFDAQPKHTTITYTPYQHQPLRLDASTYNSSVNGVRTHTDILNGNVLDNFRRVNGVNGNGPVRSTTRSPHRPDDLLIFEDADDLRRSTQDDPQNALVCLMASLNASPAASPTASTNSASASSMSSVSVLTPSPPTGGTSVPSVASTTAPCSTQLHARSNNATEFSTNSTPAFCAWQTYQREDSYSSWRSEDSGTPRPNTPAFPVYPRTPYANNGVHHFDTTGLPPKSPTTQRKDRSPSPSSEQVLSHSSSTTSVVQQHSPKSIPQNGGQMSPTVYSNASRRSSTPSEPPQYVLPQHVKFVRDTSRFWYKPNISREEAIATLRDAPPGTFVVRDSNSFPGAFGLALKVAVPPATVAQKAAYFSGDASELVRHFLIEPTSRGVRLKGCTNEPVFSSLSALVYQHSLMPMALPCKLLLPEGEPMATMKQISDVSGANPQFTQGAACNVLYLLTLDTESLTGPQAVRKAVQQLYVMRPLPIATVVHFKVSSQGITLTDNKRRLFFRRHYPTTTLSHCGLDPDDHRWTQKDPNTGIPISSNRVFGFVARKPASKADNQCHIFADLEPEQPANAIVNFVCKVMATSGSVKSNMV